MGDTGFGAGGCIGINSAVGKSQVMPPLNSPKPGHYIHNELPTEPSPGVAAAMKARRTSIQQRGRLLSWGESSARLRRRVKACPSGRRLRVHSRLPASNGTVGFFHYAPSAGNSACAFFEKDLMQEEEMERLHRIKVHPLTGCFHSRPGHYSKLHGLQNFQSTSTHADEMMSHADGRSAMLARIKASLTEPGVVTSVNGMERIGSSQELGALDKGDGDGDVEFHSVGHLAINRMVRDNHHEHIRYMRGALQRRRSLSSLAGASGPENKPDNGRYKFQGALDVRRGRFGERSVDDAATSERHITQSAEATHWGTVPGMAQQQQQGAAAAAGRGSTPRGTPRGGVHRTGYSTVVQRAATGAAAPACPARHRMAHMHRGEPLIGSSTTILRHLYFQPGEGGPGGGGGGGARALEQEFRRQRQRSGSTLLGWESHTVKAHERTEAYLHDLGALAPTMNPNDLLLAEITSAYDVDPDGALGGGGGSGGGGSGGLGEGASATVRRAMHRDTGRPVAIKAISKRYLFTQAEQAGADREMVNQRRLCHRHVVRLYETYETDTELFLVLERATCGSLDDLLFVRRRLTELEAKIVLKQVLDAVQYCHAQGIVHCDLKPANIVLSDIADCATAAAGDGDGAAGANGRALSPPRLQSSPLSISGLVVKLCDFGHSRKVPDVKYFKYTGDIHKIPHHLFQHTGTQGYISPEILLQNSYGKAADMWSCGVLMHKLLSGAVPWNSPRGCLQEPLALKARLWNDISDEAKDLLRGLLEVDQELRLSASQALNHAWFAGIEHCTAMPTYAPGGR